MATIKEIKNLCDQIAHQFKPERIILFGSHAYGTPTVDSDIDLLVVMPFEGRSSTQAIKILNAIDVFAPVDLLVRTSEQIQERLAMEDTFMREIIERGKVLYEANYG